MAGDGVSLQTNIAQLGNLAKSQSRAQQAGAVNPDQARQLDKEDAKPLEKVRETEQAEKSKVDGEEERARQRKQRRAKGDPATEEDEDGQDPDDIEAAQPDLGGLVDTKA